MYGQANAGYGIPQVAIQRYVPIGTERRTLEASELKEIETKSERLLPKLCPGYATPLPDLLASPGKQAAATAAVIGLGTAIATGAYCGSGAGFGGVAIGAGIGALVALVAAPIAYLNRRRKNEDVADIMARLPPGATYRDYRADPDVQQKIARAAANRELAGAAAIMAGAMATSARGNRVSRFERD
jgi:hypothetical protein